MNTRKIKKTDLHLPIQKKLILPEWIKEIVCEIENKSFVTQNEKMEFTIYLSKMNVHYDTGGPFGAVIFCMKTHQVLGLGVNRVVSENASIAHGEIMAFLMAQEKIQNFDLGSSQIQECSLFSTAQPCLMCFGAMLWSGVKQLVFAARKEDVEKLNYDEGPILPNWKEEAQKRGIQVESDVMRKEACEVLKAYSEKGGVIYNPEKSRRCRE